MRMNTLKYILQGYWRKFVRNLYEKTFKEDPVDELMYKAATCSDCYLNGSCLECGCPFSEMAFSDKPCPKNKF